MGRYPTAVIGLSIILGLIVVSIYTVFALPYDEAVAIWRGDQTVESRIPRNALPVWVNHLRKEKLPPTIVVNSRQHAGAKSVSVLTEEITEIAISLPIDYSYGGGFPEEMVLYFYSLYDEKEPHVTLSWVTPTGRETELRSFSVRAAEVYHFSQDALLARKLDGQAPIEALFGDPTQESPTPLKGIHVLRINALLFEEDSDVEAELVATGQVYGWAGTDVNRRDLMVALLWGTPVALAFGLVAAIATSVIGMLIAAVGTWFGGWADRLVQFLTEVNLILPFFPVSLMVFTLYSKSLWTILGVTVALSIFGNAIKTYRATFLQVKESPYIEAARAYGASDWRIVVRYLIPRIMAVLIPKLVILVPSYVFLEATLAFLGVSDPQLPTWGKLVVAALSYGVHRNQFHLVLAPLSLLMLTGFAFAMVGLALERVFEPRLRET